MGDFALFEPSAYSLVWFPKFVGSVSFHFHQGIGTRILLDDVAESREEVVNCKSAAFAFIVRAQYDDDIFQRND